ncbi:MAG TPA: thrombospondin type 3 repeat-containing protein [Polyangia bacterium]|nr:thrombospondin type 3 repeat-containing protein [Polyangia bacterium]
MRFARFIAFFALAAAGCGNSTKPARCGDGIVQLGEQCDDGNSVAGDGCEADCTMTPPATGGNGGPTVIECAHASDPPLASGVCSVTAGSAAQLITGGSVLLPGKVLHGGQVLVDDSGVIQCVDCDCTGAAAAAGATMIACPTGVVSPGLINPHDHVTYDQESPAADTGERFEQRNDWRLGLRGHTKIPSTSKSSADALHWNELRFLLGGATSEIGSGGTAGFLRNLDVAGAAQEGLVAKQAVDNDTFPLDSSSQLESGCAYTAFPSQVNLASDLAYQAHVSEGIDDVARNEFLCLSGAMGGMDITAPHTSFVHAVGLLPADYQKMAQTRTSLIWSPRSNVRLYGDTAMVTTADRLGVQIALGTDWTPSGSINLLRELACADSLNTNYFAKHFTDEQLWLMVTRNAAASVNYDDVLGTLKPGAFADIAIFDGSTNKDHRAVIAGAPETVALVERGGKALYGDADVVNALATGCDPVSICGGNKAVCAMSETGKSFMDLQTANSSSYAAFFCNGPPADEPTCTPTRPVSVNGSTIFTGMSSADDMDGDGVPNTADNCPTVFNPIRPVDNGAQGDVDGDGIGDACDSCPMDSAMSCAVIDPADVDGDGIANGEDNCPTVSNPDQADADEDMKGDACDACPNVANPGSASCWHTIYDVKTMTSLQGQLVGVKNAIVTSISYTGAAGSRTKQGYFLQMMPDNDGYVDENNSGVFVFGTPPSNLVVGSRVDLNPTQVTNFHGEIELQGGTPVVKNPGAPEMPGAVPVVVTPDQIATGGARATALEGVLVQVQNVTVTDPAPAPAGGEMAPTNEFAVTASLRIDDFGSSALPYTMPGVDDAFASITGVLAFRNANTKVGPRSAADLVAGPPHVAAVTPNGYTRVGAAYAGQPTIPASNPMMVVLSGPTPVAVDVMLMSSDPATLTVPATVQIPANASSVAVPVTGVMRNTTAVTITASLNGVSRTGTVQVLGDGITQDQPTFTTLAPPTGKVGFGGTINLTASLDLPAGAPVPLTVASANGWTVAPAATIALDTLSTTIPVTQAGSMLMDTITVSDGTNTKMSMLSVNVHPVINEVDYDQPSTDTSEFIELYNPNPVSVNCNNLAVVLATNSQNEYLRVPLTGITLAAGDPTTPPATAFLVIGTATVNATLPTGVQSINFALASNNITNTSSNPTGIAIIDTTTNTVVDSVSFGTTAPGVVAQITGVTGKTTFAEGTWKSVNDNGTAKSCARHPNGVDNDNLSTDWVLQTTPNPGLPNP